jgi:hypothetical protein
MPEQMFMELGMYIITPELISAAYFINPSHQFVCLCVYPSTFARHRLSENVTTAMNTHNNERIVGCIIFCVVHKSKEIRRFFLLFDRSSDLPILKMFSALSLKSSVSIATGYALDGRGSIPGKGKRFFPTPHSVQTSSEAHPASHTVGARVKVARA